jgi:hypothetical protein
LYKRILGIVYGKERENWRILTNKELYAIFKNTTLTDTMSLPIIHWFVHIERMEEKRIPRRVLCLDLETRPRNIWKYEVRADGRLVGGERWQENYITDRNVRSS